MIQSRFWQGFFALAPLIGVVFFVTAYLIFIFSIRENLDSFEGNGGPPQSFIGSLGLIFGVVLLWILVSFGSLVFYIIHAAKNPNLSANNLLLVWILVFIFANGIGQLIYWIIEILNKKEPQLAVQK
jgi:hypothetical protein